MRNRINAQINAGSMADIAFLMLIFFIISATLDSDQGIMRKLPPADTVTPLITKKRDAFIVLLNKYNELFVQDKRMDISELRSTAKIFIENPLNESDLPEKELRNFPFIDQVYTTPHHIISLQNDRGTTYAAYVAVQNELTAAYNELRDEASVKYFNIHYADLDAERKLSVDQIFPLRISEVNPVEITTNNQTAIYKHNIE